MTMGTPDFNTALQMLADWLVFLDEKKAELRAKMAMTGAADFNAAFKEAPADAVSLDAPIELGDEPTLDGALTGANVSPTRLATPIVAAGRGMDSGGASGRVLPFSPFDEDAPADLPDVPIAGPAWLPPTGLKPEAAQMMLVSDSHDPLEGDSPISSELDTDGDEDEYFRQAMRPGPARPSVITPLKGVLGIDQAPTRSSGKLPIPAADALQRAGRPGDSSDLPVLAVEPATNPLDALETTWGTEAAPELAKRRRRALHDLPPLTD
jgi:hypothetical protein